MVSGGPKVGEAAPVLEVNDIDGRDVSIGRASPDGKSTLMFFLSPNCPVCKTLLPVLKSSQKAEADWLEILLASDGDVAEQQKFIEEFDLVNFTYLLSSNLGLTYQVGKLPFAVLLDHDGITLQRSRQHPRTSREPVRGKGTRCCFSAGIHIEPAGPPYSINKTAVSPKKGCASAPFGFVKSPSRRTGSTIYDAYS